MYIKLLNCGVFLSAMGLIGFIAGRLMPKKWIDPEKGWFRSFAFENKGAVYESLGIRKWHRKLPDMSRILPFLMQPKSLSGCSAEQLSVMIRETCVAELVHIAVSILGCFCIRLWPGMGGLAVCVLHFLVLNLPYILIQRYNRPRLLRLQRKLLGRDHRERELIRPLQLSNCG